MKKATSTTDARRAKLFWNGRSQAVRLPKEFRFDGDEVEIRRDGDTVLLLPVERERFPDDFWSNIDGMTQGIELPEVEPIGGRLLEPNLDTEDS